MHYNRVKSSQLNSMKQNQEEYRKRKMERKSQKNNKWASCKERQDKGWGPDSGRERRGKPGHKKGAGMQTVTWPCYIRPWLHSGNQKCWRLHRPVSLSAGSGPLPYIWIALDPERLGSATPQTAPASSPPPQPLHPSLTPPPTILLFPCKSLWLQSSNVLGSLQPLSPNH